MSHISLLDIYKNKSYRDELTDTLCNGIVMTSDFRDIIDYVIDHKLHLFDTDELVGTLYDGEDEILDMILPSIRRVYVKVYQEPPTILKGDKLQLYFLLFDIDEFLNYLLIIIQESRTSLKPFTHLDRTIETITLIVDNFIAKNFSLAYNCIDIKQEIRDLKIKKISKKV